MASRRDQLQSYQFLTQRVLSALVMRETDPAQSPLRRGIGAVFIGIMVAVMVGAGFGVYGILTKSGSTNWKTNGAVIVEKESGASYVFQNGQLNPMLNYASALLAAAAPVPTVFRVSSNSLAGIPRGVTRGIPGAPNSLPPGDRTVGLPWTLCSAAGPDDSTGPLVTLAIDRTAVGGRELADTQGLLVADERATYLVWKGRRYLIQQPTSVVAVLFGSVTPTRVGTAWINGLPAGEDIAPIPRPTGTATVLGHRVGELLVATPASGAPLYYLVYPDGVAPLTALQATLVQPAPTKVAIDVDTGVNARRSAQQRADDPAAAGPRSAPELAGAGADKLVCARTGDARGTPTLTVGGSLDTTGATPTGARSGTGTPLAGQVLIPAGRVALVRIMATPTQSSGALALVTDVGVRYSVSTEPVWQTLGFAPERAVGVPAALVALLPAGPALDPLAAARAAAPSGAGN
jgi:type VII secretion protein EccB